MAAKVVIHDTCSGCGPVELGPDALVICRRHGGQHAFCLWSCPGCARVYVKRPPAPVLVDLYRAGCAWVEAPPELLDPVRATPAALTTDDLIDFHGAIEESDYLVRDLKVDQHRG